MKRTAQRRGPARARCRRSSWRPGVELLEDRLSPGEVLGGFLAPAVPLVPGAAREAVPGRRPSAPALVNAWTANGRRDGPSTATDAVKLPSGEGKAPPVVGHGETAVRPGPRSEATSAEVLTWDYLGDPFAWLDAGADVSLPQPLTDPGMEAPASGAGGWEAPLVLPNVDREGEGPSGLAPTSGPAAADPRDELTLLDQMLSSLPPPQPGQAAPPAAPSGPSRGPGLPVAVPDTYTTLNSHQLPFTRLTVDAPGVLANDRDPQGLPLWAQMRVPPGPGRQVMLQPDGSFTYLVFDPRFTGVDTFTYVASTPLGVSRDVTVTIDVTSPPPLIPSTCTTCECEKAEGLIQTAEGLCPAGAPSLFSQGPIRYADGTLNLTTTDLASDGFGTPWGHTRSWTNGPGYATTSENGVGTVVSQLPKLIAPGGDPAAGLALVSSGTTARHFAGGGGGYTPVLAGLDRLDLRHDPAAAEFLLTDTTGNRLRFHDFSPGFPAAQRGQLESVTDPAGNVTSVARIPAGPDAGKVSEVQRSATAGGVTVTESYLYSYLPLGDPNAGRVANVTLRRRSGSAAWTTIRQVEYAYYGVAEPFGNVGDLKTAVIKDGAGSALDTKYYRYYTPADAGTTGYVHGLKYVFDPRSFARLAAAVAAPFAAPDGAAAPFADYHFQYDPASRRVIREVVQGAGSSTGPAPGQGAFTFSYTTSPHPDGFNNWKVKTTETLPDGNQHLVYTNAYGQVLLKVFRKTSAPVQDWAHYYQYDGAGRLVLHAQPSAVGGYTESAADLLLLRPDGTYEHLANGTGLIERTDYYTTGPEADRVRQSSVQRGELGVPVPQRAVTYLARTVPEATVVVPAAETVYRNPDGTGAQTTSYAYTWFGGTTRVQSRTETLPAVPAAQNGPGTPDVETTFFDAYGREVWRRDSDGFLHHTAYDPATGAALRTVADVDTTRTGDFTALPAGWATPPGGGLHLVTQREVDGLGRTTRVTDPNGNVHYTVYKDAAHEVRTYPGWQAATGRPTGPTQLTREHRPGGYTETLTLSEPPAVDPATGRPTGAEPVRGLHTLARRHVNSGGQLVRSDAYFNLAGLTYSTAPTLGTEGTHFYRTRYDYDDRGRQNRVQAPTGTVTRTTYDGLGRPVGFQVGTSDANLVPVWAHEYDLGGVGDGHRTRTTEFPDGEAAPRVTQYFYDWRGRLVATKDGVQALPEDLDTQRPIRYREYDNLGRVVAIEQYDGDNQTVADLNDDGVPDRPPAGLLRARSTTAYDDRGRAFRSQTYSVNPATGAVSPGGLTTDTWYDRRGQAVKSAEPGGLVHKTQYDGAGRVVRTFTTDGGGDGSWADAGHVLGDVVLGQDETRYDANGNALLVTTWQRFHDAPGTGELTGATARVSHTAFYYDAADRLTALVDVGTNGGAAYTRPPAVPPRSDTTLVTGYTYNAAGWVDTVTDPRGLVRRTSHDNLGRDTRTVHAYTEVPLGTVLVNQEQAPDDFTDAGASWEDLGTFTVTGDTLVVRLSNQADEFVEADAVRVEPVGSALGVLDGGDAGYSTVGPWLTLPLPYPGLVFQGDADFIPPGTGSNAARWAFGGLPAGQYRVSASWLPHPLLATDARFTLSGGSAPLTVTVNQEQAPASFEDAGAWWHDLGVYTISGGSLAVELSDLADGYVEADAVRIERVSPGGGGIRDSGDAGFATSGLGWVALPFLGNQLDAHFAGPGTGDHTASWTFGGLTPGQYRVSATWVPHPLLASDAPFTVLQGGAPTASTNHTTRTTYDGSGHVLTRAAVLPGGLSQTTQYVYGVTQAAGSSLDSNDLLAAIRYPDKATGLPGGASDQETFTYNALGEVRTARDRNGTVHAYAYDVLGRPTADAVTTLGAGVDGQVRRLGTAYDGAGRPFLFTSYDLGGAVVNQVQRDYNGLGQLAAEHQAHAGPVVPGATPRVQYAYSELSGGANHSRLVSTTYPNGRVLSHGYGPAGLLDDRISRLSSLAEGPLTLEGYTYLGLDTIVKRAHPQPGVDLTYVKQPGEPNGDAGDPYTGLDRFGRVVDQRWLRAGDGAPTDRFQYGYDRNGNRLYRANLVDAAFSELYHANGAGNGYDALDRLTDFQRGTLNASRDAIAGTPAHGQGWGLDAMGNWSTVTTDGTPQDRGHNLQNQITSLTGQATPLYDNNGNLTRDQIGRQLAYDAWNRLTEARTSSGAPLADYRYDALGRRVVEGGAAPRELYYSSAWQVLEERESVTGPARVQYVWSPVYVDALVLRDRDADWDGTPEERRYVQQDANFNVTALVNPSGAVVERYVYDAYGLPTVLGADWQPQSPAGHAWSYLHQGGRFDPATGLYHFRHRELSPVLGRWLQQDPIGTWGDRASLGNGYAYVGDNPLRFVDPLGLVRAEAGYRDYFYDGDSKAKLDLAFSIEAWLEGNCDARKCRFNPDPTADWKKWQAKKGLAQQATFTATKEKLAQYFQDDEKCPDGKEQCWQYYLHVNVVVAHEVQVSVGVKAGLKGTLAKGTEGEIGFEVSRSVTTSEVQWDADIIFELHICCDCAGGRVELETVSRSGDASPGYYEHKLGKDGKWGTDKWQPQK